MTDGSKNYEIDEISENEHSSRSDTRSIASYNASSKSDRDSDKSLKSRIKQKAATHQRMHQIYKNNKSDGVTLIRQSKLRVDKLSESNFSAKSKESHHTSSYEGKLTTNQKQKQLEDTGININGEWIDLQHFGKPANNAKRLSLT